jgi:hypothetical protein
MKKTCNPSGSIKSWLDLQGTTKMSQMKQANPTPQTRKRKPLHMMKIKKTPLREVTKRWKRPSRKVTKTLRMRRPVSKSWRRAWKKRKKGKPRSSTRRQKKRRKLKMRRWKRPVLWKRDRRRGPEGSQGSRRILSKQRKRKTAMMRVPKMKRRARKRSKMRPKKTERKSRRMNNRRKSRR